MQVRLTELARIGEVIDAALAAALGGSLGALLQATTNPSDGGRVVLGYSGTAFKLRAQARTSIAPSELTIQASVPARWQFLGR